MIVKKSGNAQISGHLQMRRFVTAVFCGVYSTPCEVMQSIYSALAGKEMLTSQRYHSQSLETEGKMHGVKKKIP